MADELSHLAEEYGWRNIAYHLIHANQADTLYRLLLDLDFLQAKLNATDPNALIADCDAYLSLFSATQGTVVTAPVLSAPISADNPGIVLTNRAHVVTLLRSMLSLSLNVLTTYPDQLPYQIVGRLWTHRDHTELDSLWQKAHASTPLELVTTQEYPP